MIVSIETLKACGNASISYVTASIALFDSYAYLIKFHPLWTVDSWTIDNVAKDHDVFVDFHWILHRIRWIYVENNAHVEVKGIGTYKLCMRDGRTLLLHDILFAPDIQ